MEKTLSDFDLTGFDPSRDHFIAEVPGVREYEHVEGGRAIRYAVSANGTRHPVSMFPFPEAGSDSTHGSEVLQ